MKKELVAEAIGTMVLVLMGCGSAVFNGGVGTAAQVLTVSFAFGLSVVAMAYTIGGISGCHINPAITLGVWLSGRMKGCQAISYMVAQVIGALVGSAIIFALTSTITTIDFSATTTGANGFTDLVPALIAEIVFTFIFVLVVLGSTSEKNSAPKLAGLAIGLTLVLVHIVCIPITGTSVNPARSIAPAIFAGGSALAQLWVFIVGPFIGAALSAIVWKALDKK
ncbi:MAG: MIP family channel protein [Rikenellaceae bacterium]